MMLRQGGVDPATCYIGNVFRQRPLANDISKFFLKKLEAKRVSKETGWKPRYDPYGTIGVVRPELEEELDRLRRELVILAPNVVLAFGNTALWALTGYDKITQHRGTTVESKLIPGLKVVPTYHPAAVLRKWDHLPFVVADIKKASAESPTKDIVRPSRKIMVEPSADEVVLFLGAISRNITGPVSVDIETAWEQVTCIGFAPTSDLCMVVPFVEAGCRSYWSYEDELKVWGAVQDFLQDNSIPKLFQNGSYDIQFLRKHNISVRGEIEDTMLMHHALQPELPKGLGDLASLYTSERAWKWLANHKMTETKQND